jgi:hypothetical protein
MRNRYLCRLLIFALALPLASFAGVIMSPVAVVSNTGGEASPGDVQHIIDQSGLTPTFVSGTTDFDTYMALNPQHTFVYLGFEWFGANGVTSASIVLDMGSAVTVTGMAFWNDEFSGTQTLGVLGCSDSTCTSTTNLGSFLPVNNPAGVSSYSGEVFDLADISTRYIRLDVTGPQANDEGWNAPSIGEVAFDVSSGGTTTPEPSTDAMFGVALLGLAWKARRRF